MIGVTKQMWSVYGEPRKRFILVFAVASIIAAMLFIFSDKGWKDVFVSYLFTFSFWYGNYYFFTYIDKKYPDLKDAGKKLLYTLLFVAVFTLVVCVVGGGIVYGFEDGFKAYLAMYLFAFFITILISAIHGSISYFHLFKASIEEKEAMKRVQMENELKVLTSQVNPHFLFNSLNTLMSLIPEDSDLAVKFTQKLSDVYRYVLQSRNQELTSLENELSFAENYIFLMKIRFGENLVINKNIVHEAYKKKIPVLSMQMLIENATKHNTISASKPLEITINANNGWLEISNNRNPKLQEGDGTGTGLENISKRYAYFSDKTILVEEKEDQFSVKLPLLEVDQYESIDH
jgi:two-component system LytT family sensor kinase